MLSTESQPRAFAGEPAGDLRAVSFSTPRVSVLQQPLALTGKSAEAAASLGLNTVGDLLEHLPRARREARTIARLQQGETATVVAEVRSIVQRPVRRRGMRPLVEATVADETGLMKATFFNQPWLEKRYPPGTRLVLHGKYEGRNAFRVSHHALTEEAGGAEGGVSHYPATEGLSSTQILALVRSARDAFAHVPEPLPAALLVGEGLATRGEALQAVHFGESETEVECGRRRLAFEELLLTQLALAQRRARRDADAHAAALAGEGGDFAAMLPFELTGDQAAAVAEIGAELDAERPMQRLLMGEVGSGKTVVALYAMLRAVEAGQQAVLMAPTETLAEQHFASVQRLIGARPLSLALLTGSTPAARRAETLARLATGELGMLVGTHAVIEPDVRFRALAVAVVDEQHRFGVRQRTALDGKAPAGRVPHVLHMTATPIPRTLALAAYGDLDQTRLRELPSGRRPIATHVISGDAERARAYERIREELSAGRQAFVVCPLVDESEDEATADARAATAEYERLTQGELREHRVVLMHGQMSHREKQAAMTQFAAGEADVLVSTTVIEVGIDVPNATVMLVENAERFGISQLHQLRGRVGRGAHESLCLLSGPKWSQRLRALAEHDDGFELAEIDLELRREGDLIGTRQSGVGHLRVAVLPQDEALLVRAREWSRRLLEGDPQLRRPEHVLLAEALADAHGEEGARAIAA
jgi:ATP-dependent DNA helicase RecG